MDCDELILLIEQFYDRICRKKRALCWNFSGALCANLAEVICLIKNLRLGLKSQMTKELRVASFSLLVNGTIMGSRSGDLSDILGPLLACRCFLTLRRFADGEKHNFLPQRNILHAVAEIKQWIRGVLNCESFLEMKMPLEQRSILQLIQSILKRNCSFNERCSLDLAHLLVLTALQHKRLVFVPNIIHSDVVYNDVASPVFLDKISVFDHAILLPVSLSLEAQLLLLDANVQKGKIVLFSCSLMIEGSELEAFVSLLRSLHVCFVASQRVLGSALKEALFEMNILPLERLSLNYSGDVQTVTGATPFHSLCEFVVWMNLVESNKENVCVHIGEVGGIVNLNDGRIWIYGKGDVATVLVPVRNPFVLSAIISNCEEASHIAHTVLRGFAARDQASLGVYEAFFAEYVHYCYLLHPDKNRYLTDLVHVLRFTLLSYALNTGFSPDAISKLNCFDVSKKTIGTLYPAFSCQTELKRGETANLMHHAAKFERRKSGRLWQCAELIWTAIDNASLLFRVKESM